MKIRLINHIVAAILLMGAFHPAFAQDNRINELGLLLGIESVPGNALATAPGGAVTFGKSEAFQLNYARRLFQGDKAALWLEFPALAGPSHEIRTANPATPVSVATFYVTPSFRVNIVPRARVSPWLSFGGGYSLFETSEAFSNGVQNPNRLTNTAVLQFGGGADFRTPLRILVPINLRAEVRDFHSFEAQDVNAALRGPGQHGVVISGGLLLRW
jgi:hypothetical protein